MKDFRFYDSINRHHKFHDEDQRSWFLKYGFCSEVTSYKIHTLVHGKKCCFIIFFSLNLDFSSQKFDINMISNFFITFIPSLIDKVLSLMDKVLVLIIWNSGFKNIVFIGKCSPNQRSNENIECINSNFSKIFK